MQRAIVVVAACVLIICLFFVFDVPGKLGWNHAGNDSSSPASSISLSEEDVKKLNEKVPILLYFVEEGGSSLAIERRYIDKSSILTNLQNVIMAELLKGPGDKTGMTAAIPEGTKMAGPVTIKNQVAVVNLSKEFVDAFPSGKTAQSLAIYSIVNSLSELKEISSVKFLINGVSRKDLGNFKFNAAFQRTDTLVDKFAAVLSTGIEDIIYANGNSLSTLSNTSSIKSGSDAAKSGTDAAKSGTDANKPAVTLKPSATPKATAAPKVSPAPKVTPKPSASPKTTAKPSTNSKSPASGVTDDSVNTSSDGSATDDASEPAVDTSSNVENWNTVFDNSEE